MNLSHLRDLLLVSNIDYEVIVVDNNSTDNTVKIINKFLEKNKINLRIIINKVKGLAASRKEGIKHVNSEFVCFVDDDNFLPEDWICVLKKIIKKYNPDVIGCSTVGITNGEFPSWWQKYKSVYACGKRFNYSGFLANPLDKFWGAGLVSRSKFIKPALLKMDLLCSGRINDKQFSGEDVELNYRMKLLGAKFYNSNELCLKHYIRKHRLDIKHLKKTLIGNAYGSINLDAYKYLITKKIIYKLPILTAVIFFGFIFLSFRFRINYFKFAVLRILTLKERMIIQKKIKSVFLNH